MALNNNNDVNEKLEKILTILNQTNKNYKEDIENINKKIDNNINNINQKIENLENKFNEYSNINIESNNIYENKSKIYYIIFDILDYKSEEEKSFDDINNSQINTDNRENNNIQNSKSLINHKKGKRGKYKFSKENTLLIGIKHLYIKENEKIWHFSLSKYNENAHSGYYYCSDTNCAAKCVYTFSQDNISEFEKIKNKTEKYTLTKDHTLEYLNHNYIINENIIKDMEQYNKNEIIKNFENLDYLKIFIKKYAIKYNNEITSAS